MTPLELELRMRQHGRLRALEVYEREAAARRRQSTLDLATGVVCLTWGLGASLLAFPLMVFGPLLCGGLFLARGAAARRRFPKPTPLYLPEARVTSSDR